jgi:hypothetical protein
VRRVLRGPAVWDVVTEGDDGRFALTATGALLQREAPGSQRGAVRRVLPSGSPAALA